MWKLNMAFYLLTASGNLFLIMSDVSYKSLFTEHTKYLAYMCIRQSDINPLKFDL